MEDALVQWHVDSLTNLERVLILVLMEDALVLCFHIFTAVSYGCLNPCFNGRCTRTELTVVFSCASCGVLILVLMEDALVQIKTARNFTFKGLNPCFNGRCTRT